MDKLDTKLDASQCENFQLKWHSYNQYLNTCIATALSDDSYADVALVTMDGHQIMAHRFVLAYASQYMFKVLKFQKKVTTALPIMVVLPPEISFKAMKILVKYMYTGEATVSKDILKEVLRGGDILKIKGLYREEEELQHLKAFKQKQNINSTAVPPLHSPVVMAMNKNKELGKGATENQQRNQSFSQSNTKPGQKILLPKTSSNDKRHGAVKQYTKPKVLNFSINSKFGLDKENSSPKATQNVILNNKVALQKDKPHTITSAEAAAMENSKENPKQEKDGLSYLVIKEEPVTWGDDIECEEEGVESEMRIKSESCDSVSNDHSDSMFSPLTCELCTATFTVPAEWVRHVQTHTDMLPAKRRRRDSPEDTDMNATYPELQCDLCDKVFQTPGEWVRHINKTHTEYELGLSNRRKGESSSSNDCSKNSHKKANEPFQCVICSKGFNVKSNLLRHLRTVHNTIINSSEVDACDDCGDENSNSN